MTDPADPLSKTQVDGTRDDRPTDIDPPAGASREAAPPRDERERAYAARAEARPAGRGGHHGEPPRDSQDSVWGSGERVWFFVAGGVVLLAALCATVIGATKQAGARLVAPEAENQPAVAIADQAELSYCTPQFKEVLERVLHACGLEGGTSRRGCAPSDVKSFASISDEDFNALFTPLKDRGAVLLFDNASHELDATGKALLEERWVDRKGARYFFVVARASKSGNQARNRALSHRRANSVKFHVESIAQDPELDRKVGQLWLGNEFAQLSEQFCEWPNSRKDQKCNAEAINRSVFVSWVDCRL